MKPIPNLTERQKDRFFGRVAPGRDGCHFWQAHLDRHGYGQFSIGGSLYAAHRVAFCLSDRAIEDGEVIDHVCRNRNCVNPDHLRAVSGKVNSLENSNSQGALNAAKTHCHRGHVLAGSNVYVRPDGSRDCRLCRGITRQPGPKDAPETPPDSSGA